MNAEDRPKLKRMCEVVELGDEDSMGLFFATSRTAIPELLADAEEAEHRIQEAFNNGQADGFTEADIKHRNHIRALEDALAKAREALEDEALPFVVENRVYGDVECAWCGAEEKIGDSHKTDCEYASALAAIRALEERG